MILAITNIDLCLVVAIVLFVVAAVLAFLSKSFYSVLMAAGLVFFALAFIVDP